MSFGPVSASLFATIVAISSDDELAEEVAEIPPPLELA